MNTMIDTEALSLKLAQEQRQRRTREEILSTLPAIAAEILRLHAYHEQRSLAVGLTAA